MEHKIKMLQVYERFCSAEGNQHIASEYAILKLQHVIRKFDIKNVLEVGLGIGSIAGTLIRVNENLNYTGTEINPFCLKSLSTNIGSNYERLRIHPDLRTVPANKNFDLAIVDGNDVNLKSLKKMLSKRGMIVLEGDRLNQQKELQDLFPRHKIVHSISLRKNKSYSPFPEEEWQGGLKIIFINPSRSQNAWWLKEKILTMLKYQFPGRHFGVEDLKVKKPKN
ncbi:hypothetical protein FHG64_14910 [Antarcticibacterium flavum]|uniref:Class I SAM-dependent methyltransferase n=1 Tax=Antarcticibacterium flavum TaxID=2058175 RepID=A0A5B7X682_9FLAO|nr:MULTISPECIES: hypothetical protein [Antarcticibacterium]MCM4161390.1 hypothetical protein [Antarcticibacterium sp. W02-3]QCY70585.1 hypothetical protein FHG64_14910 [Antarcticibacterium flavum]